MNTRLDPRIIAQVRGLLSQGYRIGTEHADARHFKTSSWKSCAPIESNHESQVVAALEACLRDHTGQYVRLIGIDTKSRSRVLETLIQRPDGTLPTLPDNSSLKVPQGGRNSSYATTGHGAGNGSAGNGSGNPLADQVRGILNQGCRIGLEYADQRRFRTSSWQSAGLIDSLQFSQVMNTLQSTLQAHQGEYVRLLGVDPVAKRRVVEVLIQRPDGQPIAFGTSSAANGVAGFGATVSPNGAANGSGLSGEILGQIRGLLSQGFRVGAEYADQRRFRTGSWQTCPPIEASNEHQVIASLSQLLSQYQGHYVRLLGVDPQARRRVLEVIVQRP